MIRLIAMTACPTTAYTFNSMSESSKNAAFDGTCFIYGSIIAMMTDGGNTIIEYDTKWNRVQTVNVNERFQPNVVDYIHKTMVNEADRTSIPGKMIEAILLGIRNGVDGDEFTKGFQSLFGCDLTHKITRNYITGGYHFQVKDEAREKYGIPNDYYCMDTLYSFLTCMQWYFYNRGEATVSPDVK